MARDVVKQMQTAASTVLEGEPVIVAYLFGSQATGQARPDSDVDVAVLLDADEVDNERVVEILRSRLDDLDRFREQLARVAESDE